MFWKHKWKNWSGNQTAKPAKLCTADSLSDLQSIVAKAGKQKIRLAGGSLALSPMVPTADILVETSKTLTKVLDISPSSSGGSITLEAGADLQTLIDSANQNGMQLPSTAFFPTITMGGGLALGAHGTGLTAGTLSDLVSEMSLVMADGSLRTFSAADGELWDAVRLGFGSMGILYSATFDLQPFFSFATVSDTIPDMVSFMSNPDQVAQYVQSHPYLEIWWYPFQTDLAVKYYPTQHDPTQSAATAAPTRPTFDEALVAYRGGGNTAALATADDSAFIDFAYALPVGKGCEKIGEAWLAAYNIITKAQQAGKYNLTGGNLHGRFIGESTALLSPARGNTQSSYIEFGAWATDNSWIPFFEEIEDAWLGLGGRPHWGKMFSWGADFPQPVWPTDRLETYRRSYGDAWSRFLEIKQQLDPGGRFTSPFIDTLFHAS